MRFLRRKSEEFPQSKNFLAVIDSHQTTVLSKKGVFLWDVHVRNQTSEVHSSGSEFTVTVYMLQMYQNIYGKRSYINKF